MENEITYYSFYSQVRSFVAKLKKDPIGAQPGETLKKVGLTKNRLINILIKRGIIERHESIKDKTDGIQGEAKYVVKYIIKLSDAKKFERTVKKMFVQYCEKNLPVKESVKVPETLQEEDGGGAAAGGDGGAVGGDGGAVSVVGDGTATAGATNTDSSGQYTTVTFPMMRRDFYNPKPQTKKKKVTVNEAQFEMLKEFFAIKNKADKVLQEEDGGATTTFGVGDYTYDKPVSDGHQNEDFWKDSLERGDGKDGSTSIPKKRAGEK